MFRPFFRKSHEHFPYCWASGVFLEEDARNYLLSSCSRNWCSSNVAFRNPQLEVHDEGTGIAFWLPTSEARTQSSCLQYCWLVYLGLCFRLPPSRCLCPCHTPYEAHGECKILRQRYFTMASATMHERRRDVRAAPCSRWTADSLRW